MLIVLLNYVYMYACTYFIHNSGESSVEVSANVDIDAG